jgi:hypothetical protein
MSLPRDQAWFRAKRYGYGWGLPLRWQGWVVLAIYLVPVFAAAGWQVKHPDPLRFAGCLIVSSVLLVAICAWKGEPARWRWGRSSDDASPR